MKLKTHLIKTTLTVLAAGLVLTTNAVFADAPLKSTLDLDLDQAAKVEAIQKNARDSVRPVREALNREERALRRAKIANDSAGIARQETVIAPLRGQLAAIFAKESEEIQALLTPEQKTRYEEYLKVRDEMVGSSRDVKSLQKNGEGSR